MKDNFIIINNRRKGVVFKRLSKRLRMRISRIKFQGMQYYEEDYYELDEVPLEDQLSVWDVTKVLHCFDDNLRLPLD